MKQNIFDIVNSQQHPAMEIKRIDTLLHESGGVYVAHDFLNITDDGSPKSVVEYVDDRLFRSWKQRGTCISCNDFRKVLGITTIPQYDDEVSEEFILTYCEYAANILFLLTEKIDKCDAISDTVETTEENIKKFLGWYNYELKYYPKEEMVLVVSKNAAATVVAESTKNQSLAYCITEYNHFLLKGNMKRKKEILLMIGADLEPRRKELNNADAKLEKSIFFLLNNMNLRHNNREKGSKSFNKKVAAMRNSTLEKWYDKTYQLMLTAYMILDCKKLIDEIDDFAKQMKNPG